jgi:hypothetical protein
MDWIKTNSEKFALLLLSVVLLAVACLLFFNEQHFIASFDDLKKAPFESNKMPALETKSIEASQDSLAKPSIWDFDKDTQGWLFFSQPYFVVENPPPFGSLKTFSASDITYPPVPNSWLLKYKLDLLDPNILSEDADGNGFSNLEKYIFKIDPTDKSAHPPYVTKLFLEKYAPIPFRLLFKGKPDADTFQIDMIDTRQPTQFVKMGDQIENTKYKLVDYKEKNFPDPDTGMEKDVSELTLQNTETNAKVVLVIDKPTDDPTSFGLFEFLWNGKTEIRVKLGDNFTLKPEPDVTYKLIDIDATHATIQNLKTNEEINIPLYKQGAPPFHELK